MVGRTLALLVVSFVFPPAAVLIARDSFDGTFIINLLLTLLGWLPGCIHAVVVVLCCSNPYPLEMQQSGQYYHFQQQRRYHTQGYEPLSHHNSITPSAPPMPHYPPPVHVPADLHSQWPRPLEGQQRPQYSAAAGVQGIAEGTTQEATVGYPAIDFPPKQGSDMV